MAKPTWQFEHASEANVPCWFAWEFWSDVSNWERVEGDSVEWIRLDGPFALGTSGATKVPGQSPQRWTISQLEAERSATIEMSLDGAVFSIETRFQALDAARTLIRQRMTLAGDRANEYAPGMTVFERNAPQGLARLVAAMQEARSFSSAE